MLAFGTTTALAQRGYSGRLVVCAIQAQRLENTDGGERFGAQASDPYVTIKVGSQTCASDSLRDSPNPVWNKCCDFGVVDEDTAVQIVVTDQDDHGDDDLIGLACTAPLSGTRWLDLIRHDTPVVMGSVQVYTFYSTTRVSTSAEWRSINGTSPVRCPADYQLTDCTCLANDDGREGCDGMNYGPDANNRCTANSHVRPPPTVGARCVKAPSARSVITTVHSTTPSAAFAGAKASSECPAGGVMLGCLATTEAGVSGDASFDPTSSRCEAVSAGGATLASARCASRDPNQIISCRVAASCIM